ncbi:hypothetical protein DTO027I6_9535 [Penicillium roqueforti]|nr:hypothetical protein CBS147337_7209 [Penicillium roqueforti]KAI2704659.1 hypothetical protein CBS147332_7313 [Penicillium roqueforti]KAI3105357.1 hypothetical protein CBS147331_7048 [Penicillium roqueforti]KAI3186326.1 hypothetical protein DTO027I6_9535 [Penicillium roqueforti]KAI3285932.1 hypothetical protein DTO002I6_8413 [Penicillium roqueforti]
MALIDPNQPGFGLDQPDFGLDQPAFDPEAFLNSLTSLDANVSSNASNDFEHYQIPELLCSFDEFFASIPLDDLDQSGFGQSSSATSVNCFTQPLSSNIPAQAPYRQMPYDPSIGIAYTSEDTDASKVRSWENLISQANLVNAGVPPSTPQIMEEETASQGLQTMDSPDSLFNSPGTQSVASVESVEIVETPSPTSSTPCPPRAPAATTAPSNAATNVIASAIPSPNPRAVQLPRALTNQKGYAQHVSPFAPVATIAPPISSMNSRELENARARIQTLARERNYYQRNLRKATNIDPKSGKTSLQLLQAENVNLRRANSKQSQEIQRMKNEAEAAKVSYATLAEYYNDSLKQLHKAELELEQLRK